MQGGMGCYHVSLEHIELVWRLKALYDPTVMRQFGLSLSNMSNEEGSNTDPFDGTFSGSSSIFEQIPRHLIDPWY